MNLKNSLYKVEPTPFNKVIELPGSKSHANRALIVGAIKGKGFTVYNLPESTDVTNLLNCLKSIGLNLKEENSSVTFLNSFPDCEIETNSDVINLKTGDGGTTNRFLLALLSLGHKTYRLIPSEKMRERPMDDLLMPLKNLNVKIEATLADAWISIQGPALVKPNQKIEIDCTKSTQFASAMMLAFSSREVIFDLKNIQASEAYIEMTKYVLGQIKDKNTYTVPVDFSSASYPIALALIHGRVLIRNCKEIDSTQADSAFIKLMKDSGADISWTDEGLLVTSKNKLAPFKIDGSKFPDLVPTLAFVASHLDGESVLSNLSVLRHKESDRIEQIIYLLKTLGVNFSFDSKKDELTINGKNRPYPNATLKTARDHRIVMTAYLFLRANSGGFLSEFNCVEKSFPRFFILLK